MDTLNGRMAANNCIPSIESKRFFNEVVYLPFEVAYTSLDEVPEGIQSVDVSNYQIRI